MYTYITYPETENQFNFIPECPQGHVMQKEIIEQHMISFHYGQKEKKCKSWYHEQVTQEQSSQDLQLFHCCDCLYNLCERCVLKQYYIPQFTNPQFIQSPLALSTTLGQSNESEQQQKSNLVVIHLKNFLQEEQRLEVAQQFDIFRQNITDFRKATLLGVGEGRVQDIIDPSLYLPKYH